MEERSLSKGWKWVRLGEVIKEALPGFACGKRAGPEGFIQLRMNNISSNGHLDLSSVLRIPATKKQVEKYQLLPGCYFYVFLMSKRKKKWNRQKQLV